MNGTSTVHDRTSVVIAARNAGHTITGCLEALQRQTAPELLHEVIVVDNNSTDDTAVAAARAGAMVVHQPVVGAAAARNAGIAAATGDIIAITDADCVPADGWLEAITAPLRADPSITAAKGAYRTSQRELFARFVQLEYEDKYDLLERQELIDFVDTYSAAYRRDAIVAVGGFNQDIFYVEDQELSFRLAENGARMVFAPKAVVEHLHADSLRSYLRKKYFIGYWKAFVVRRYPNVAVKDSHTPQVLKVQMLLASALGVSVGAAPLAPAAASVVSTASAAAFGLSSVPFVRKAWRSDRAVGAMAPFGLLARAVGLTAGFGMGTLAALRRGAVSDPDPDITLAAVSS
ncbi:MAG: glycosyltransferase [Acidimicrobiales bacterium]